MERHEDLGRRLPWLLLVVLGLAMPAAADDLEQRMERLEARMERLIRLLEGEAVEPSPVPEDTAVDSMAPADPVREPDEAPPAASVVAPVQTGSEEVRLRYFMSAEPMDARPPKDTPLADGLFRLEGVLAMDPFRYGAAERRLIGGGHRDPSQVRAVGILLEGELSIPQSGPHRFELTPKPAREGGETSSSNILSIHLWVDGEPVLNVENVRSWRRQRVEHALTQGRHPFRLWVVSNSPGFGTSPIDSRLGIEIVMPGRAEVTPLWRLMSAPR